MTKLLIAGSRHMTNAMRVYAIHATNRAIARGWYIIVGDAPGIDATVLVTCNHHKYHHVTCYAPDHRRHRHSTNHGENLHGGHNYTSRDHHMIQSADKALFIWNGQSPGTKSAYDTWRKIKPDADAWLRQP